MEQQHSTNGENGIHSHQAGNTDSILHVTIHHAKDIHNICIYGNQDVYAKFLITHYQDAVYPTQPVKAGGKNPVFNQSLEIPVCERDAVLKCELWMMSCARNYLEDQLLGFVMVPLKTLYGKGKQTQEYYLTSTDLFYTPAGTVYLSLLFHDHGSIEFGGNMVPECDQATCLPAPNSCEVMMDCGQQSTAATNLCKVEFLDLEAASEDQHLVSMYYKMAAGATFEGYTESNGIPVRGGHGDHSENGHEGHGDHCENGLGEGDHGVALENQDLSRAIPSAVQLHASHMGTVDDEMLLSPREEKSMEAPLLSGENSHMSGFTSPSEMHKISISADVSSATEHISGSPLFTGTQPVECIGDQSQTARREAQDKDSSLSTCQTNEALPYAAPLVNISVEPEMAINQEHFVDLYLKSMQQFTEKLADMKFSFDMEAQDSAVLRSGQVEKKVPEGGKKEGPKLYYGSRAFY